MLLRPAVEWLYRRFGKGPAPVDFVEMTDERRHYLERLAYTSRGGR